MSNEGGTEAEQPAGEEQQYDQLNSQSPVPASSTSSGSKKTRLGSITPAQAKAFLRQGSVGSISPPPAYTSSSMDQQASAAEAECSSNHSFQGLPTELQHSHPGIQDPRTADTPFGSPAPFARRKPRVLQSPPTSMPMGMKERGGPEPDSADWSKLTNRCDPIQIRDRYQNPVHLERTILSPAVTEVSEQPTRPGSFRTQSSIASLSLRRMHANNGSEDGSLSAVSSVSGSATSAPLYSSAALFEREQHHDDSKSRSDPALRQVRTVSAPPDQRPRSSQALVEFTGDEQEELDSNADGGRLSPSAAHLIHHRRSRSGSEDMCRRPGSRRGKSARDIAREQQRREEAEDQFSRRLQARERYLDRKDMLIEKQALIRTLHASTDPVQQSQILRELGEMSLTSAMDLAAAGSAQTDGYTKVSENAVVCLRQALERQIHLVQTNASPACTSEDVSETWYLLGRAHEALSNGIDAPEGLAQRQFALASYGHALEATRNPASLGRIWCSLGVLQCSLRNYAASREAFDRAVQEDSRQVRAWLNLGQLWENWFVTQGTEEEQAVALRRARNSYFRAVRLDPNDQHAQARLEALGGPPEELSYTTSMSEGSFTESTSNTAGHDDDERESTESISAGGRDESAIDESAFVDTPHPPEPPVHESYAPLPPPDRENEDQQEVVDSPVSVDTTASPELPVPHSTPIQVAPETSEPAYLVPAQPELHPQHPPVPTEHPYTSAAYRHSGEDPSLRLVLDRLDSLDDRVAGLEAERQGLRAAQPHMSELASRLDEVIAEQRQLRQTLDALIHLPESQRPQHIPSVLRAEPAPSQRPPTAPAGSSSERQSRIPVVSRGEAASNLIRRLGGEERFGRMTVALGKLEGEHGDDDDEEFLLAVLHRLGALRLADFLSPSPPSQ